MRRPRFLHKVVGFFHGRGHAIWVATITATLALIGIELYIPQKWHLTLQLLLVIGTVSYVVVARSGLTEFSLEDGVLTVRRWWRSRSVALSDLVELKAGFTPYAGMELIFVSCDGVIRMPIDDETGGIRVAIGEEYAKTHSITTMSGNTREALGLVPP